MLLLWSDPDFMMPPESFEMSRFSSSDPKAFGLQDFLVEPSLNRITGPEGAAQVEPRIMGVLVTLAARPGEVWSRNDLLDEVWHDTIVNEETLTRAIFHLRRHLGDESGDPRFIETIRKGGYRLVCPVEDVALGGLAPPPAPAQEPMATLLSMEGSRQEPSEEPGQEQAPRPDPTATPWRFALVAVAVILLSVIGIIRFAGPGGDAVPDPPVPPPVLSFTSFQGPEINPAISPDGSLLTFSWRQDDTGSFDLYVKHLDGETPLRLTNGIEYEGYSTWSPEGADRFQPERAPGKRYLSGAFHRRPSATPPGDPVRGGGALLVSGRRAYRLLRSGGGRSLLRDS